MAVMFVSSIKKRIILSLASICIVSIGLLGILAYHHQMSQLKEGVQDLAENQGRLFSSILIADADGLARAHTGLGRLDSLLVPFAAGDKERLLAVARPIFSDIRQNNNITHMYFIKPDGTVLLRVHKPEEAGDVLKRTTFLKARQTGQLASGLEMGKNFFSLRCVRPVSFKGRAIGYMEVAEEIDHVFKQMKTITGNDESLFLTEDFMQSQNSDVKSEQVGSFRILYPTSRELTLGLAAKVLPEMKKGLKSPQVMIVSYRGGKYAVGIGPVHDASGATVGVLFSQKEVSGLFKTLWIGVAANLAILLAVMFASVFLLYLSLRKSLALFALLREHIVAVTTSWDLTRRLKIDTDDEIGQLAADFNAMTEKLAEMVLQVNSSSAELGRVSRDLLQVSSTVLEAAEQQSASVHEVSDAMGQINCSIKGVGQGVDSLSQSSSETSSSVLEMAASVEEVALNAASLTRSVDEVGSAITEMAASIKQVGQNADHLMDAANINSSSIMQMDYSIREIERNAMNAVAISEAVRADAEIGKQAVESTMLGINAIKDSSQITSEVIANLSKRAGDIGAILSVIDEVAGKTNLLSLNAAIIAAQAGEYGKGFAVVAGEIKQLADSTSNSTREIAKVIKGVLEETERAVSAIQQAEQNIAEGERLSRQSGEALEKIVSGVQMATQEVNGIARATAEQSRGSQMIREATEQVTAMVREIAGATKQQTEGSAQVLASVERMKVATEQVKNSTREQSNVGGFIAEATENVTEMIRQIKKACDEQSLASDLVVPAMGRIKDATGSNQGAVTLLGETMSSLAAQIEILQREIDRFQVRAHGSEP